MSHARKVVAIVEDEAAVRRSLERLLRSQGIESESFPDGERFLQSLGDRRPNCVILGHRPKETGGMEAFLRMTVERLRIPILVVTGRHSRLPKRPGLAVVKRFPNASARRVLRRGRTQQE